MRKSTRAGAGRTRSRGVTPTLTYVFAIGISTLLISGLLIGTTGFVEDERQSVVREELEIIGDRLAAEAVALDDLDGANATKRTEVPAQVADTPYYVDVVSCPAGNACLELTSADPETAATVTVPVNNESAIRVDRAGPRTVRIKATPSDGPLPGADADLGVAANVGIAENATAAKDQGSRLYQDDLAPVVSGIEYSPARPTAGETVTFESNTVTFIDGNYTYSWDLDGDGTAEVTGNGSAASNVTTTYANPGRYSVTLTITGPANRTDTVTRLVRVSGLRLISGSVSSVNVDANDSAAGVGFTLANDFSSESVTITDVALNPANPAVDGIYNPTSDDAAEIRIGTTKTYTRNVTVFRNGTLVQLESAETVGSNDDVAVTIGAFYAGSLSDRDDQFATYGQTFNISVRYETSNKRNFVSMYTIAPGSTGATPEAPEIDDVNFQRDKDDDTRLDWFEADITDPNGDLDEVVAFTYDDGGEFQDKDSLQFSAGNPFKFTDLETFDGDPIDRVVIKAYDDDGRVTTRSVDVSGTGGGGGGTTAAESVSQAGAASGGTDISFQLENTGSSDVTLSSISVAVQNGPAKEVDNPGGKEVTGGDGAIDGSFNLGDPVSFSTDPTIEDGETETFTIGQFRKNNDDPEDVSGRTVEVTINFADGSGETYTLSP